MRLPQRDPYAPREWQPHEKPALLGSPSTPIHSTPKRIAYGVVDGDRLAACRLCHDQCLN